MRKIIHKLLFIIALICFFSLPIQAVEKEPWNLDGHFRRAVVVDNGLSALRKAPSLTATCLRRLKVGRAIYIISTHKSQNGIKYYFVAVTRRTRGFIDASALVSPSQKGDDGHLAELIETAEGVDKILLSQILVKYFPYSEFCPNALLAEATTAEKIATELSSKISRHLPKQLDPKLGLERYLLNYSGLDKYNRLGVNFLFDKEKQVYFYDGAAYKKILSHYRKSKIALIARERLQNNLAPIVETELKD